MSKENLGKASYFAFYFEGKVTILGFGANPTAGYENRLELSPIDIFPPEHILISDPPSGPAAQVVTMFKVEVAFEVAEVVPSVVVNDANGRHDVQVHPLNP
ncbi:MAG: hypothetical protein AB8G99_10800 [Planctomycetaceae bacterium]